jgi:hypothetical protein
MKNLDFLPEIYKQRDALRRARVWWGAVVVIFGTAIGLMAGIQFWLRHDIRQQLSELQPQFVQAQTQVRELASLNAQIAKAGRSASLFTFLEDPWPRTQILAELIRPLPRSAQLTRIQIGEEEVLRAAPQAGAAPRRRGPRQEEDEGQKLSPVEQDLAQLRADAERRQAFVDLEGQTHDVAELHAYVAQVGSSPLFTSAEINSLEDAPGDEQPAQMNFTLRAIVRPGYAASSGAPASAGKPQQVTSTSSSGTQRLARGGSER